MALIYTAKKILKKIRKKYQCIDNVIYKGLFLSGQLIDKGEALKLLALQKDQEKEKGKSRVKEV